MEKAATYDKENLCVSSSSPDEVDDTTQGSHHFSQTKRDLQNPQIGQLIDMLMLNLQYRIVAAKRNPKGHSKGATSPVSNKG